MKQIYYLLFCLRQAKYDFIMRKTQSSLIVIMAVLIGIYLSSCSGATSTTTPNLITATPTKQVTPISLSGDVLDNKCVQPFYDEIPIKLVFSNLTEKDIRISNSFSLSVHLFDISYEIVDENGVEYMNSRAGMIVDEFPNAPTPAYQEIAPNGKFELVIPYHFPESITSFKMSEKKTGYPRIWGTPMSPKSGKYSIKFTYFSHGSFDKDQIWDGWVESNLIEVCIQ